MIQEELTRMRILNEQRPISEGSCDRCGRRVLIAGTYVTHIGPTGTLWRGCRAASFTPDNGWDESLNRHWTARIRKHGEAKRQAVQLGK